MVAFGVFAWDADVFVLLGVLDEADKAEDGEGKYHVECNDIFEGDFAGFVFLDEDFVDSDW